MKVEYQRHKILLLEICLVNNYFMISFPVWEAAAWRDFTLHKTRRENKFISFWFYLFINSIS